MTAGSDCRHQVGSCNDSVSRDLKTDTMKGMPSLNDQNRSADSFYDRSCFPQEFTQRNDLRLSCCILKNRNSFCPHRCQNHIFRNSYTGKGKPDYSSLQLSCLCSKAVFFLLNLHSHFAKRTDMEINRSYPDHTPSRVCHRDFSHSAKHGPKQCNGRTHSCHIFPRHDIIRYPSGVDGNTPVLPADFTSNSFKQHQHMMYIRNPGTVIYHTGVLYQKCCGKNRQRRILRALYSGFSKKSISSSDMNSVQIITFCLPVKNKTYSNL